VIFQQEKSFKNWRYKFEPHSAFRFKEYFSSCDFNWRRHFNTISGVLRWSVVTWCKVQFTTAATPQNPPTQSAKTDGFITQTVACLLMSQLIKIKVLLFNLITLYLRFVNYISYWKNLTIRQRSCKLVRGKLLGENIATDVFTTGSGLISQSRARSAEAFPADPEQIGFFRTPSTTASTADSEKFGSSRVPPLLASGSADSDQFGYYLFW